MSSPLKFPEMLTKRWQSILSLCAKVCNFCSKKKKGLFNSFPEKKSAFGFLFFKYTFNLELQFDKQTLMVGRSRERECTLVS